MADVLNLPLCLVHKGAAEILCLPLCTTRRRQDAEAGAICCNMCGRAKVLSPVDTGPRVVVPTSAQKPVSKLTSGSTSSSASKLEDQELASELKSV